MRIRRMQKGLSGKVSAFTKELLRTIRKSKGRFIAIVLIVALGAGFYAGLRTTAPDMRRTMDRYMDDQHMMDIRILSTIGLAKRDVDAVRAVKGVQQVMAADYLDTEITMDGQEVVMRVHSLPADTTNENGDYLNRVKLTDGRMPENADECVVMKGKLRSADSALGSRIRLGKEADGVLQNREFTVVGLIETPMYMSYQLGSTDIGNGTLSDFMYIPQENFTQDYYTEIYVTVAGASALSSFSDEYDSSVKAVVKKLEAIADAQLELRRSDLTGDAEAQLEQAKKDYETGKQQAETELSQAEQKLNDVEKEINGKKQTLADAEQQVSDGAAQLESGRKQLSEGRDACTKGEAQLTQAQKDYEAGMLEFQTAKAQAESALSDAQTKLYAGKASLLLKQQELSAAQKLLEQQQSTLAAQQQELADLNAKLNSTTEPAAQQLLQAAILLKQQEINATQRIIQTQQAQVFTLTGEISSLQQQLTDGEAELLTQRAQAETQLKLAEQKLDTAYQQITANRQKLAETRTQLDEAEQQLTEKSAELALAQQQLADGKVQLADGETQLQSGRAELEAQRARVQQELADAQQKITDGENQLAAVQNASWYVLDRHANVGFASFESDCQRMDSLSKVFPLIFFMVAALVALTTMTRMVEEERSLIGTYCALGYSKSKIMSKYLIYAAAATLGGCALGLLALQKALPVIVWNSYRILYSGPSVIAPYSLKFSLIGTLAACACTLGATVSVCRASVSEYPALLLLPKAPKAGKRILLERIPFVWKHLNFINKVTARNIFRYKKRLIMTVVGIAGCTGLLLTGFGIKDSISTLVTNQYREIYRYDIQLTTTEGLSDATRQLLRDMPELEETLGMYKTAQDISGSGRTMSAYIMVPESTDSFADFINLRDRRTHKAIAFNTDSVVVTEKLAERLGLSVGGTVTIQKPDCSPVELTVTGITENYIMHYIYIAPELYRSSVGEPGKSNLLGVICAPDAKADADAISRTLTAQPDLDTAISLAKYGSQFDTMISSLNYIILVIIVCAGLLAFVVLYNLTNINISEREREIATIKVLGFYKIETAMYIYRETILLTLLGCLFGLGFGVVLHSFVIRTVEVDMVMFGRVIQPLSYLWAALITFAFSALVNLVMYRKLTGVSMVESLKSVD